MTLADAVLLQCEFLDFCSNFGGRKRWWLRGQPLCISITWSNHARPTQIAQIHVGLCVLDSPLDARNGPCHEYRSLEVVLFLRL